jgi:hypothetical protein
MGTKNLKVVGIVVTSALFIPDWSICPSNLGTASVIGKKAAMIIANELGFTA